MILRKTLRAVATLLLGVMLFAQSAIAFGVCQGEREPARAMQHAMDDMACCTEEASDGAALPNANLCLAHCTSDVQSADSYALPAMAAPMVATLTITPHDESAATASRRRSAAVRVIASPPLTILFQNFRI